MHRHRVSWLVIATPKVRGGGNRVTHKRARSDVPFRIGSLLLAVPLRTWTLSLEHTLTPISESYSVTPLQALQSPELVEQFLT